MIAARAAHEPLLAIGAYRTDEIPRGSAVRRLRVELRRIGRLDEIELGPLDAEATIELASQVLGARPDDTLAGRLVDRSQGLPLFVEELAAALLGDDAVSVSGDRATLTRADLPIPDTLRDSILVRTDGLSPAARRALVTAALLGDPIDGSLIDELAPDAGGRRRPRAPGGPRRTRMLSRSVSGIGRSPRDGNSVIAQERLGAQAAPRRAEGPGFDRRAARREEVLHPAGRRAPDLPVQSWPRHPRPPSSTCVEPYAPAELHPQAWDHAAAQKPSVRWVPDRREGPVGGSRGDERGPPVRVGSLVAHDEHEP